MEIQKPIDHSQLKQYLDAQVEEIQRYKWIESERARTDIGFQKAALDWIQRFGDGFRRFWWKLR